MAVKTKTNKNKRLIYTSVITI